VQLLQLLSGRGSECIISGYIGTINVSRVTVLSPAMSRSKYSRGVPAELILAAGERTRFKWSTFVL
jgi:hypothetical protein